MPFCSPEPGTEPAELRLPRHHEHGRGSAPPRSALPLLRRVGLLLVGRWLLGGIRWLQARKCRTRARLAGEDGCRGRVPGLRSCGGCRDEMAGIVNDALRPFPLGTNADHKLLLLLLLLLARFRFGSRQPWQV